MLRVVLFLVVVGLIALAKAWLADRPGEVAITWLGWRIETSVMVLTIALIALVLVSMLLWSILRGVWRTPAQIADSLRGRRESRSQRAIVTRSPAACSPQAFHSESGTRSDRTGSFPLRGRIGGLLVLMSIE